MWFSDLITGLTPEVQGGIVVAVLFAVAVVGGVASAIACCCWYNSRRNGESVYIAGWKVCLILLALLVSAIDHCHVNHMRNRHVLLMCILRCGWCIYVAVCIYVHQWLYLGKAGENRMKDGMESQSSHAVGMESYVSLKLCDLCSVALCDFSLCVLAKTVLAIAHSRCCSLQHASQLLPCLSLHWTNLLLPVIHSCVLIYIMCALMWCSTGITYSIRH